MSEWQQGFGVGVLWSTVVYLAFWWCIWRPRIEEATKCHKEAVKAMTKAHEHSKAAHELSEKAAEKWTQAKQVCDSLNVLKWKMEELSNTAKEKQ